MKARRNCATARESKVTIATMLVAESSPALYSIFNDPATPMCLTNNVAWPYSSLHILVSICMLS